MKLRPARLLFLITGLALIASCDPEALVKQKVPDPVKSVLTFSEAPQQQKPGSAVPIEVSLKVLSPQNEAFFPIERPIPFKANVRAKGAVPADNELIWSLIDEKTKQHSKIGQGKNVERKLPAGHYQAEVAYQIPGGNKVTALAKFRVGPAVQGAILYKGAGLADADLLLTDLEGKQIISRAKSEKDGVFFVEIQGDGDFKLTPAKQGFGFTPIFRVLNKGTKPDELQFRAARGQIGNVHLTGSAESDEPVRIVCPEQTMLLKATVSGEAPLTRLEAYLVPAARAPGQSPISIGTVEFSDDKTDPAQPTPRMIEVRIPPTWTEDFFGNSYGLLVTASDAKGDSWSSETTPSIRAEVGVCLRDKFAQASALEDKGDLEGALKVYDLVADLQRTLGGTPGFSNVLEKALFNRGLINLRSALKSDRGSLRRSALLTKALADFQEVSRLHRKDAEASFFAGVVSQLKREREAALDGYRTATRGDPQFANAYEFMGRLLLETRRAGNLSRAVDAFTRALSLNPDSTGLRAARKAALNLDLAHQDLPREAAVDTSSVPLEPVERRLDLEKYRRK